MYIFLNLSGIETATGRMGLDLYEFDYISIATGCMYRDSHWPCEFYNFRTVMPLGVYNETTTGRLR